MLPLIQPAFMEHSWMEHSWKDTSLREDWLMSYVATTIITNKFLTLTYPGHEVIYKILANIPQINFREASNNLGETIAVCLEFDTVYFGENWHA